jgi:hypothetical protein
MVGPGVVTHANLVNGLRVKQLQKAPLNANGFLSKCQNWSDTFVGGRCCQSCSRDAPMTDAGFAVHLKFLREFRKERSYDPHGPREVQMQRRALGRFALSTRKPLGRPSGFVGSPVAGGSEWQ